MAKDSSTILIIEDEEILRESMADYLEDRNFRVLTADNGRKGLEMLKEESVDLILTDLRMPEVDGLEVLRKLGDILPEIPSIVVSGTGRIGDSIQALRLGAWDYILKPVEDMSIISIAVNKALERARLLKENRVYQEKLELLVEERTAELEQANRNLSNINTRLHKIVEITGGLSHCKDIAGFGATLLEEFATHMLATGGSLFLVEKQGLRLLHVLESDHVPPFIPFPLPDNSILKHILETKKPLLIEDISLKKKIERSGWSGYKHGSVLAFPLPDENGLLVGLLTLHNKTAPPFTEQDKEIGAILASYSCETLRVTRFMESLRKSERRYRTLFSEATDAIFIFDKYSGRYLDTNRAGERLCGRSLAQLKQLTTGDIIPDGDSEMLGKITQSGKTEDVGQVTYVRPDGEKRIAALNTFPLDDNTIIGIARDLTDEFELENQLRQAQKMEAIGQLVGGIAHDFNNMLTGILGGIDIIKKYAGDNPKIKKIIEIIMSSSHRAADLIAKLLAFSRKAPMEVKPIVLHSSISSAIDLLERSIDKKIDIKTDFQAVYPIVIGDSSLLQNLFLNLGINARDAMPDGGTVYITTTNETLDFLYCKNSPFDITPGMFISIEVTDTGTGMSDEVLSHIFEPFFTTKARSKGTGLGLPAVYGTIKDHHGAILVRSEVGCGTSFQIFLPVTDEKQSHDMVVEEDVVEGTGCILVVDDEEIVRFMTKGMLEELGYEVITAKNGKEALSLYQKKHKDIDGIVLDFIMPEMDGRQCLKEIRAINPQAKVIISSGFSRGIVIQELKEEGAAGFIKKPFKRKEISRLLADVLD